ncbi:hypothetical protein PAXINDRAFT_92365 [Paxillus involutus ATCC 200175]|uniref:Integrase core domain-containing protein n=1 Tax=Paxillus involutus ATCC 200175 TaxID=664439 RepID=A0A0C9TG27_PAXIN|nr:hypothetical protein PAXINDRAFT_92365 [Paxillus involutus ATCC 200175]
MPNQNKPTPPLELIQPHIMRLWKARMTDREIVSELQKHIDTNEYGIGLTKFVEIRNSLGLRRTRQQKHTTESIREAMMELRAMYPKAGAREVVSLLFHEKQMCVARNVVCQYFAIYEPELVRQRKAGRLQRRRFWAAGVNDIWAVDQHDKFLRFGLALHTGIEPFSGRILWMKVWHSNRNPQLILSYYLSTVEDFGFIPLVTQSDPGTENFGIANAQTMLRQMHDPGLAGFVQHRWMRKKKNIMPEIAWSQLRRRFSPGFEALLEQGTQSGWYDVDNTLQLMVFRWVFIPWLQEELNAYQGRVNLARKRRDRNKVLPHGRPELIHTSPEDFGALDFKVTVDPAAIQQVRNIYIKPDHPVFDLVPGPLNVFLRECYNELGCPVVDRSSVWTVYRQLHAVIQYHAETPPILASINTEMEDDELALLEGLQDLPFLESETHYYMGGVGGGLGLGKYFIVLHPPFILLVASSY